MRNLLITIGLFLGLTLLFSSTAHALFALADTMRINEEREYFLTTPGDELIHQESFISTNVCLDEQDYTIQFFKRTADRTFHVTQVQELWAKVVQGEKLIYQRIALKDIPIEEGEDTIDLPYDMNEWNIEKIKNTVKQGNSTFFWIKKYTLPYDRKLSFTSEDFEIYLTCD